jgi:hypothetical protein
MADELAAQAEHPRHLLAHAHEHFTEKRYVTASERAFGTSSHDGAFTGFGAEFDPYSYTDPRVDHSRLDPEVRGLGAQHVRIFVPLAVVQTSLLGKAGPDWQALAIQKLEAAVQANPADAGLKTQLAAAQAQYVQQTQYVSSFVNTLALAGKNTTINLTFCGAAEVPYRIDIFARVVRYLVGQGYGRLQLTLENEPNGPDQSNDIRGQFDRAVKNHDQAAEDAAVTPYVAAYQRLDAQLADATAGNIRDQVQVVGGDMVLNNQQPFFATATRLGLNQYVDDYSFHLYWGANKSFAGELAQLHASQQLAHQLAPGKPLQITEFGIEHFTTAEQRKKHPGIGSTVSVEAGVGPAYQQGMFALSAVNDGFSGLVKWEAFYGGARHKGDGKGEPGQFYMIGGPGTHYAEDATYRLMRTFTHATEPGWLVHGTNHGAGGAVAHFASPDGADGAILAMSKNAGSVIANGLPQKKLYLTTWNIDGKGGTHTEVIGPGICVRIPPLGAVAISTRPPG